MSKSSMKIVLVDPLGDILFSGDSSLIGISENDDGRATTTSGIYPRMKLEVETEEDAHAQEAAPAKSGTRAA